MQMLITEILGWLTFLHRPSVLLQLLALAALAHGCAGSRAAEQHGAAGATPTAVAEMLCAITQ